MSILLRNPGLHGFQYSLVFMLSLISFQASAENPKSSVALGQVLAKKLCQACHEFKGADQPGNVAPPFVSMKKRFPDRKKIRAIIYDAQVATKADTMMPPFGRHGFVNDQEIEMIIDFLYTQ